MGLIKGWDLIIDSSLLAAWYHDDPDAAWGWPSKWKGRVFGYKVHTILCRWSYLPLLFVVTPANCNDGPLAIPMFAAVLLLYHLRIRAVWADTAYFNYSTTLSLASSATCSTLQSMSTTTYIGKANAF